MKTILTVDGRVGYPEIEVDLGAYRRGYRDAIRCIYDNLYYILKPIGLEGLTEKALATALHEEAKMYEYEIKGEESNELPN